MERNKPKVSSTTLIFAAMLCGAALGLAFGEKMSAFKFIGDVWLNCIKLIIVPLVMCIMIQAVGKQQDTKSLGRVAFRIIFYYFFTTVLAAIIGLLVASVIRPGDGLQLSLIHIFGVLRKRVGHRGTAEQNLRRGAPARGLREGSKGA